MTSKNLLGKSRNTQDPYAIYEGYGPFGKTEMRLLKTYQLPINEAKNTYARWFVAVKSEATHGSYDMGDSYPMQVMSSKSSIRIPLGFYHNNR